MSDKKRKVPKLRFPGFTDAWEQRKLGEISKRVTRKNSNLESTLPLTISAQYGLVDQITFFNKQIASKDMSGYYLIKKGEFAYNKSYSKDAPWGAVKRLDNYDKGVLSSLYIVFKLSSNIDSDFVAKYFETSNWHSEVSKRATEGARDHGLLNISASDFLSIEILIPNKTMEQKEIAQFLKLVDSTLSLHQRKLDNVKMLKKSLLQKLFPKDGEKIPELRFPGFTDAWEQRKLGEVFSERSERSGDGDLISVTINSGVVRFEDLDRKDNSSEDKSNYKVVKIGDIAYNSMRMWQGASGYSPYNGILSPAYTVIVPNSGYYSKFFAFDFKRFDRIQIFKSNSQGLTSDTWNLKYPALSLIKVLSPEMEEQIAIADFLTKFDTLISLHQRKLDHLKELKKGLLQQMFV